MAAPKLRLCALLVLALAWTSAETAQAQAGELTPPLPITSTHVEPPSGARGDATVLLELTIDVHGVVTAARVLSGEEPYASHAKEASLTWRFRPALRGEKPVASRVRFQVQFTDDSSSDPEEAPAAEDSEPDAEAPSADEPGAGETSADGEPAQDEPGAKQAPEDEVLVLGARTPTGATRMSRAEVRQLPGAFGDPFRAIEALPGVTPIFSGVPYFFVRGAPPGNVGYFLDGVRVPLLYHIGLGPSVVHPGIVKDVDLYPGGYPSRFGRFAGGIVSGETAEPRTDALHGEANVRLVDAGALVEAPFANGRGAALAGGRYSYTGLMISAFAPEAILRYWDYQARVSYELTPDDTLTLFSFGAYDYLGERRNGETETFFNTEFHRIDLRWDKRVSASMSTRTALYVGLDKTEVEDGQFVRDRTLNLRHALRDQTFDDLTLTAGLDATLDHYDVQFDVGDEEDDDRLDELVPGRTDWVIGSYGQLEWRPEPWFVLTPGLRFDLYYSNGDLALAAEPRVSARYEVTPSARLLHALGLAHQPPSFVVPVPGFQIAGLDRGLQRALQHSAGVEVDLPGRFTGSLTAFHNTFFNMTDALGTSQQDGPDNDDFQRRSLGHSYGVEVFLRRRLTERVGGFISYTLSRSERSLRRLKFASRFDRTHVLNAALSFDLGRRWRAGGRFMFYSGFPVNTDQGPMRIPPFWRQDLRLEKRWRLGERGSWALVFEVANATLNKEPIDLECYPTVSGGSTCRAEELGPVTIPSIGVEAFF